MVENRVPVNSRWLCLLETTCSISTSNTVSYLSCINVDDVIMHTNELPMFAYNLWLSCLRPDHTNNSVQLSTMRRAKISNALMCTLHDFPSVEVRFIHNSIVTRSQSCS